MTRQFAEGNRCKDTSHDETKTKSHPESIAQRFCPTVSDCSALAPIGKMQCADRLSMTSEECESTSHIRNPYFTGVHSENYVYPIRATRRTSQQTISAAEIERVHKVSLRNANKKTYIEQKHRNLTNLQVLDCNFNHPQISFERIKSMMDGLRELTKFAGKSIDEKMMREIEGIVALFVTISGCQNSSSIIAAIVLYLRGFSDRSFVKSLSTRSVKSSRQDQMVPVTRNWTQKKTRKLRRTISLKSLSGYK